MKSGTWKFGKGEINVGQLDRVLRILAILFIEDSPWRLVGLLGLAYILTGLTRWCPIYTWVGINTCSTKKPRE